MVRVILFLICTIAGIQRVLGQSQSSVLNEGDCGSRPTPQARIIGGDMAPVNGWPWQASLRYRHGGHFCGGTLVDSQCVITAAHCVFNESLSNIFIRMGAHYIGDDQTVGTEQNIDIANITIHEDYNKSLYLSHDIALIKLAKPAELGKGVGLACLPDESKTLSENKTCWITGWGEIKYNESNPEVLMEASVPILASCPPNLSTDESMLCAGLKGGTENICRGDSGGPLVCDFDGKWHLEGVTSWFVNRCAPPGGYADVRFLLPWIIEKMKSCKNRTTIEENVTTEITPVVTSNSQTPPSTVYETSTQAVIPTATPAPPFNQSSRSTCNVCFADAGSGDDDLAECSRNQVSLDCSLNFFPNLGTTHCYTARGSYKYLNGSNVIHTGIARGCINCTDKASACAQITSAFNNLGNWTLLDCEIECCTGKDCNVDNVSTIPTAISSPATAPTVSEGASPRPTVQPPNPTCNLCYADVGSGDDDLAECNRHQISIDCSLSFFPNLGTPHCYTARGSYKYLNGSNVIHTGIARGCINCTDKAAACAQITNSFNNLGNWTLLDCEIECCTGNDCNVDNVTATPTAIPSITPPPSVPITMATTPGSGGNQSSTSTLTCNYCGADAGAGDDLAACIERQTSQKCSVSRFPNLGTTHCYTAAAIYQRADGSNLNHTGVLRGCINCTDKAAACAQIAVAVNELDDEQITLLDCKIECCTGNNCNNQNVTINYTSSTSEPLTTTESPRPTNQTTTSEPPTNQTATAGPPSIQTATAEPPTIQTIATETPTNQTATAEPPTIQTIATETPTNQTATAEPPTIQTIATETPTNQTATAEPPTIQTIATETPTNQTATAEPPTIQTTTTEPPTSENTTSETPTNQTKTTGHPTNQTIPPKDNLYPYGQEQNDDEFNFTDTNYYGYCMEMKTNRIGFPFFSKRHYKLHICRNGKIQLNYEWSWWWPQKFGAYRWFDSMAIFAPFWGLTDQFVAFRVGHSKVYYHVYEETKSKSMQTSEILAMGSQHVRRYSNSEKFSNFTATWVLVTTWEKLCPYVSYPYNNNESVVIPKLSCPWSNTFQSVVITNGFNTFLMYNYPKGGIQWAVPAPPSYYRYWSRAYGLPVAGWNAGDDGQHYLNMKGSGTVLGMANLDSNAGNTGVLGRHFWRIENSDVKNAQEKCYTWSIAQENADFLSRYSFLVRRDWRMACPCTVQQATLDRGRFSWDWRFPWPKWCFRSRRSRVFNVGFVRFQMTQLCCYSTQWPSDWGALKTGPPDGSRVEVKAFYRGNHKEEIITDQQAYKYCCVDTLLCGLFYRYRPSDDCSRYRPPRRRWFWGDPHFTTLDGGNYTFNGLGEYVMIDARNGTFQLQARTGLAQGNSTIATIFTAGAAKEENTSTVEVRVKKGGGIEILIDYEVYRGYSNLTNQSIEIAGNLSVSKPEENCLEVYFPSATSVQFCEKKGMLSFVVTPGDNYKNQTKGLLGTWNDDPNDDFTLPDGTVLPPSLTSRTIHFGFGVKWQINQSQSLFTYAQNESVNTFAKLDFVPMFADNITWYNDSLRQAAEAQCGDDYECLFDVASTNDLSVGMVTKDISIQLVNESKTLDNFPPKIINAPSTINATLHETVQFNITAEDKDPITLNVTNRPTNAMARQIGNVLYFTWPVTTSQTFNLVIIATDDKGASTARSPTIHMCACDHGGQCVQPEEDDPVNTDSKFVYMGCACQGGYTGRFCESDIDACEMNGQPCYPGVECTDLPPPANASGYTCGPCPSGYIGNGAQCADIDECRSDQTNNCEQTCVNAPGSFVCDCQDGYSLNVDGHSCDDINECEPTSDCMQQCNNIEGSYNCSCNQDFKTDPADWRKCKANNPCSTDPGCEHVCFTASDNTAKCACYANYELESDGKSCNDINECDPAKDLNRCNQICDNIPGSYKCSCLKGFKLSKNGYDCEDVNECLDEDLFNCPDEFHKCVNTRGSYKCECEQGLYFIDGRCRGLAKNESAPTPEVPKPREPSTKEKQEAVQISVTATMNNFKWDFNTDKSFKDQMASVTTDYCSSNRTKCALKEARRNRRTIVFDLYTADQVHLLPGYPSNASGILLLAFYVQQPLGLFVGNVSILPRSTLQDIVLTYKSVIENATGITIKGVEFFIQTTAQPATTITKKKPVEEESSDEWKWIAIGVSAGIVVIILIIGLAFWGNKQKEKSMVEPKAREVVGDPVLMETYSNTALERDHNLDSYL